VSDADEGKRRINHMEGIHSRGGDAAGDAEKVNGQSTGIRHGGENVGKMENRREKEKGRLSWPNGYSLWVEIFA